MALDQAMLDDIAEKIAGGLRMLGGMKDEAQSQIKSVVTGVLQDLDVVTDERMRLAEAMLEKTRGRIEELEARIAELEALLKQEKSGN